MHRCLECGCEPKSPQHHSNNCSQYQSPTTATGTKHDQAKPRMDLLDAYAIEQLALVLDFGAKKYADDNWRSGIESRRLLAATLRHTLAYMDGQDLDSESGLSHLAHAMCNLMFAINLAHTKPELSNHRRTLTAVEAEQAKLDVEASEGGKNKQNRTIYHY